MVRTLPEVVDELNAIFERYPGSVSVLAAESVYSFNSSKYSDGCPEVIDQPLAEKQCECGKANVCLGSYCGL
jgi:hypothetical protein